MARMTPINRALNLIPKRAEQRQAEHLRDTFEDSGVAVALESIDHQVLYGRRGTGKTHALRYLQTLIGENGGIPIYVDLRNVGSPEGLFAGEEIPPTERAARLLVDLLAQFHDALLRLVLEDEQLIAEETFVDKLDALFDCISKVRVIGEVEVAQEGERKDLDRDTGEVSGQLSKSASLGVKAGSETSREARDLARETRKGTERRDLNFRDVALALRELADTLPGRRVWVLLDEWSSIPPDIQPYLGEFLVRCVLPLPGFTVKIAAIEQQTRFRESLSSGAVIGIELGADVTANVDLDEFMVFEQNEQKARSFFQGLLFKHLTYGVTADEVPADVESEEDVIRHGFTDKRAFDELVRAAEGVPRDAINIASRAATRSLDRKISVADVRAAARAWYQADKEMALSRDDAKQLLNWIIDKVIKQKRARGFMVNQKSTRAQLLLALFDARVLHVVKRGYSAQDEPGERYDVYVIDYGAYVDLIHTRYEPLGVLPIFADEGEEDAEVYVDVPTQDLRALRRAVLDIDEFLATQQIRAGRRD
ncbi:ATP-binding protein [Streptomyces sp. NPDC057052]|uniref:ATP-binding protein n=1 Tax=Streptomyces sp. NPDC057052 TaxID=3346010 RepID=UPI003639FC2E